MRRVRSDDNDHSTGLLPPDGTQQESALPRSFAHPGGVRNRTPGRIAFGAGMFARLRDEIDGLGVQRALVVSTPGRIELGERARGLLGDRCVGLLPEAVSQVPIELARRGRVKALDAGADCLVAVGGGAATGLCKGISYDLGLPIVAVPTTYAGSEMTGFCGMTVDGIKHTYQSPAMLPSIVIYDPELSRSLPPTTTAASALNALAHCIDASYLPTVSPVLQLAAINGARTIVAALPHVLSDPSSLVARADLMFGAYLAGAALTGGLGFQHAIAHMLGGSFEVEHGVAHAVVLPYVIALLMERAPDALGRVASAVGTTNLAARVWDLAHDADLPTSLADVGVRSADLDRAVEIASTTEKHEIDVSLTAGHDNPVPITEPNVREVLLAAAKGDRP